MLNQTPKHLLSNSPSNTSSKTEADPDPVTTNSPSTPPIRSSTRARDTVDGWILTGENLVVGALREHRVNVAGEQREPDPSLLSSWVWNAACHCGWVWNAACRCGWGNRYWQQHAAVRGADFHVAFAIIEALRPTVALDVPPVDSPAVAPPVVEVPSCRVCGCTDDDCQTCAERTGDACYWVEPDLCSACAPRIDAATLGVPQRWCTVSDEPRVDVEVTIDEQFAALDAQRADADRRAFGEFEGAALALREAVVLRGLAAASGAELLAEIRRRLTDSSLVVVS